VKPIRISDILGNADSNPSEMEESQAQWTTAVSSRTVAGGRSRSRRAAPRRSIRFARIAAVTTLAALAFAAGLLLDTAVVLRFIFGCASGACGRISFWAILAGVVLFALAVIACRRRVNKTTVTRSRREVKTAKPGNVRSRQRQDAAVRRQSRTT